MSEAYGEGDLGWDVPKPTEMGLTGRGSNPQQRRRRSFDAPSRRPHSYGRSKNHGQFRVRAEINVKDALIASAEISDGRRLLSSSKLVEEKRMSWRIQR